MGRPPAGVDRCSNVLIQRQSRAVPFLRRGKRPERDTRRPGNSCWLACFDGWMLRCKVSLLALSLECGAQLAVQQTPQGHLLVVLVLFRLDLVERRFYAVLLKDSRQHRGH